MFDQQKGTIQDLQLIIIMIIITVVNFIKTLKLVNIIMINQTLSWANNLVNIMPLIH